MFLTDDAGVVATRYAYTPSGAVTMAGPASGNPFTFGAAAGAMQIGSAVLYRMSGVIFDAMTARAISGGTTPFFKSVGGLKPEIGVTTFHEGGYGGGTHRIRANALPDPMGPLGTILEGRPPMQPNGFSSNGFNSNGFNPNGFCSNGFNSNGFNSNGFNSNGFSSNGVVGNGINPNGFELPGFAFDVEQSSTIGSATSGGSGGGPGFSPLRFTMPSDGALTVGLDDAVEGQHKLVVTIGGLRSKPYFLKVGELSGPQGGTGPVGPAATSIIFLPPIDPPCLTCPH